MLLLQLPAADRQGREETPLGQTGPSAAPPSTLHRQRQGKLQEEKLNSGEAGTEEYKGYSFQGRFLPSPQRRGQKCLDENPSSIHVYSRQASAATSQCLPRLQLRPLCLVSVTACNPGTLLYFLEKITLVWLESCISLGTAVRGSQFHIKKRTDVF